MLPRAALPPSYSAALDRAPMLKWIGLLPVLNLATSASLGLIFAAAFLAMAAIALPGALALRRIASLPLRVALGVIVLATLAGMVLMLADAFVYRAHEIMRFGIPLLAFALGGWMYASLAAAPRARTLRHVVLAACLLAGMGVLREWLSRGAVFADIDVPGTTSISADGLFWLAGQPFGVLLLLALVLAAAQAWSARHSSAKDLPTA